MKVGVLALQGAVEPHAEALRDLGATPAPVRTPAQLAPYLEAEPMTLPPEIAAALDDVSGGPNEARTT